MAKKTLRINKREVAVKATNVVYSGSVSSAETAADAIDNLDGRLSDIEQNGTESSEMRVLASYVTERTDVINGEFAVGDFNNYNVNVGSTYTDTINEEATNHVSCIMQVLAGDVVTLFCKTDSWNQGYILCNSSNVVVAKSGSWTTITEDDPTVLTIEANGTLYICSLKTENYGASLSRTYDAFRNADAQHDGLMPKEIAAMFGGGSVSTDDPASLKMKSFFTLGDSFGAPGQWQSAMCSVLGSLIKKNYSVNGGSWAGTGSASAYAQAQELVSDNVESDYILCLFGTNDVANNVSLGTIVNSETIGTGTGEVNPSSITGGAQATLITLKNAFPNTIIKIGYTPAGHIHDSFSNLSAVEDLCNRLKELAHIYGVGYIETRDCGICPYMASDASAYIYGGHPNAAGHIRIGQYMARLMLSNL